MSGTPPFSQVIDADVHLLDGQAALTVRVHAGCTFVFNMPPALGLLLAENLMAVFTQAEGARRAAAQQEGEH